MGRMRVLLADDHPRILSRLTDLLEPEFKVIAVVGDGQSLIETAKGLQPNLIITDIDKEVLRLERSVASFEEDLIKRFANLEAIISGLNAQSQFLSQGIGLSSGS